MDAQDWDRISDLLIQIRAKYDNLLPTSNFGERQVKQALDLLHHMILLNNYLAENDGKGWL